MHQRVFRVTLLSGTLAVTVGFSSFLAIGPDGRESVWPIVMLLAGLGGVWPLIGAVCFALVRPRMFTAAKIDRPFVWLDDVHPDYLASCPELPRQE